MSDADADRPDADMIHRVEQRLLCERALRSLADLSEGDRHALLGERRTAPADRREAVRIAVRRHRARARLLKLVGGLTAQVGLARAGWRWLRTTPIATTSVAVAVLVPGAALLAPHIGSDPHRPRELAPLHASALRDDATTLSSLPEPAARRTPSRTANQAAAEPAGGGFAQQPRAVRFGGPPEVDPENHRSGHFTSKPRTWRGQPACSADVSAGSVCTDVPGLR